ncbi:hypothetical protein BS329_12550 [Amycolatopsis coloradensis]|uniref:Uncharacterized protein n=1 Tax=Amycolatopsis coloradensis TaxID=76021 RepID=A0A1R0KX53_9PSEU|nr:hypothetical protein [Amycolatopsis coloradensis]OLZ53590.1 hypothetical protein BS329_12550 [Amycolatopsis coloradensis]
MEEWERQRPHSSTVAGHAGLGPLADNRAGKTPTVERPGYDAPVSEYEAGEFDALVYWTRTPGATDPSADCFSTRGPTPQSNLTWTS